MQTNEELLDLKGKRAIVTGGAVGIGFGISYRLAEAGAQVLIADISKENIATAKEQLADKQWGVDYTLTDVAQADSIAAMLQTAIKAFGGVDILVNNAGIYPMKPAMDVTQDDFERVIAVNLRSVFLTSQLAATQMITQGNGGKIINITSVDALHPSMVGLAHYDASKHGVWGLTKSMALELAKDNITVNAIAPGGILTPGTGAKDGKPNPQSEPFLAKIPMKRFGDPDEIGKIALFLASDMASYMTGSQIVADGGMLLS